MELFKACSQKKRKELERVKDAFELKGKITNAEYIGKGRIEGSEEETILITTMVEGSGFERHIYKSHNANDIEKLCKLMSDMNTIAKFVNGNGNSFIYLHPVKVVATKSHYLYFDAESKKYWSVYNDVDRVAKDAAVKQSKNLQILLKTIGSFSSFLVSLDSKKMRDVMKILNLG